MRIRNNKANKHSPPHKDTLVIIGNGFDIWQRLNTRYSDFQKYYLAHRDEIMKKLKIKKRTFTDENGQVISISDVELIYGDPFDPNELDHEFWNSFESSLDKLDAEQINLFFGKERNELREMDKSIRNANRILREAFCNWIDTIEIDNTKSNINFGDNCIFINFNYTDTLIKRFDVKEEDEYHIHGEATDTESIIFGHSSHPQMPESNLYQMGGRLRGLSFIEKILYETDKHVQDNIQLLCMFLGFHGVLDSDIKHVYVLGHSMGLSDIEYFDFLLKCTSVYEENDGKASICDGTEERDPLDELHMRLQYTINHTGYGINDEEINRKEMAAVERRFACEQSARNEAFQTEFMKTVSRGHKKRIKEEMKAIKVEPRIEDAMWHISYHSDKDKLWAETVITELGCKKYRLYPSIDECLSQMKFND